MNEKEAEEQDKKELKLIANFPTSSEKRVISFGLYGGNPKYIVGAQKNVILAKTYFPGWICRYYVTSDVALEAIDFLKENGAEIYPIPAGKHYDLYQYNDVTNLFSSTALVRYGLCCRNVLAIHCSS